jgi:acetyl-CoA carboxylase carboxyltransferase component
MTTAPESHPSGDRPRAVAEMLARRDTIRDEMGGLERLARLRDEGKLNAREHIELILDPGTFEEVGTFAVSARREDRDSTPGDGKVGGTGLVDGRPVSVFVDDVTVKRGSSSTISGEKIHRIWQGAVDDGRPIICVGATGGARIPDMLGSDGFVSISPAIYQMSRMRRVPLTTVIIGDCYGKASFMSAISDFTVQLRGTCMAVSSPRVIELATSEIVSEEDLGGADVHAGLTGQNDAVADDPADAYAIVRRFLSYLPSNAWTVPPRVEDWEPPTPVDLELLVPENRRRGYDVRRVIEGVFDRDSFFELRPQFARCLVSGLARIEGTAVGVLASQPMYQAGSISTDACDKAVRLLALCDSYGLPVVFMHDTPGFVVGLGAEHDRLLFKAMLFQQATALASVPKLSVIMRKSFGLACHVMAGPGCGADLEVAWPGAEISFMDPNVAANVVFAQRLAGLTGAELRERAGELAADVARNTDPYGAAGLMKVDEIIEPNDTRRVLAGALRRASTRPPVPHAQRALAHWPVCW